MNILFFERGSLWRYGLADGLRDLGHDVRMSGPVDEKRTAALQEQFKPDLLLSVGWGLDNGPKTKQLLLRKLADRWKVPLVYWSTEDPHFTKSFTLPLLKSMAPDAVFTISKATVKLLQKKGYVADHMDFAFHPSIHRKLQPDPRYACDLAVVANAYPGVLQQYPNHFRRQAINQLIKPLLAAGYKIDFYGRGWSRMKPFLDIAIPKRHLKGYLPYKEACRVYSSAKIVIGLQNYEELVTQRTYEAIGSSAFFLTCDTPGVRKLLKNGRDAALSASPKETVKLVQRYLGDAAERERISRNGRQAIAEHTYTNRARHMMDVLRRQGIID